MSARGSIYIAPSPRVIERVSDLIGYSVPAGSRISASNDGGIIIRKEDLVSGTIRMLGIDNSGDVYRTKLCGEEVSRCMDKIRERMPNSVPLTNLKQARKLLLRRPPSKRRSSMAYNPSKPCAITVAAYIARYYRVRHGIGNHELTTLYNTAVDLGKRVLEGKKGLNLQAAMNIVERARIGREQARYIPSSNTRKLLAAK